MKYSILFSVTPISNAAKPNGFLIKDFAVEMNSETNWTISLQPADCGSPLPLLGIVDTVRGENDDDDHATYRVNGLNSSAQVKRVQEASPPIRGTFDIEYNGILITGGWEMPLFTSLLDQERTDKFFCLPVEELSSTEYVKTAFNSN